MRKKVDLIIYNGSVESFEPFDKLEFRAIKEVKYGDEIHCEWAIEGQHDYYALYAHAIQNDRWTCIADCDSKLKLMELAQVLNTFSRHTLEIVNKIGQPGDLSITHKFD